MIEDVPLIDAELCWNDRDEGGAAAVISAAQPKSKKDQERATLYDNAVGACFSDWAGHGDDRRLALLLRDAYFAIAKDGVDPRSMTAALMHVPEFRALMHPAEVEMWANRLSLDLPSDGD